jgi:DNA end-binding protein Ku
MARAIWKGAITFGLVLVPVSLYPASQEDDIDFDWLDERTMDPVGYKRINKRTGREIDKSHIVKGVKQENGDYVLVSDDEIKAAFPRSTQTIEMQSFVPAADLGFPYYERPYYLEPAGKGAPKVYALLRDAMAKAGVIGIARVVMHNKEHLAALVPAGPALMLETLRWSTEIRPASELDLPQKSADAPKAAEMKMAQQLIESMTGDWKPDAFHDRFAEQIRELVARKAKAGKTETVAPIEEAPEGLEGGKVVDLTALLKSSLAGTHRKAPARKAAAKKAAAKASPKARAKKAA